ncbi:kynureninase [Anthocerotibacter panamensis]|uniref:kynureninase n=1 Tax=Anthocerotibacter panamensis TaxID=2857077 RepID=UPI001C404FB5|nr:kynureninase [Anthocerotibacter panamensis]
MTPREHALRLDAQDPLAGFREHFLLPEGVIYLDGNSLGALPRATPQRLRQVIAQEWGQDLIRSWNTHHWIDLSTRVGDKIAQLIGAQAGEVLVADSTSVNLFKLLAGALTLRPERRVILSEAGNFPTDLYIAQGLIELLGGRHELRTVTPEDLPTALNEDTAVLLLTQVNYKTGYLHDMAALTAQAHAQGALVLWDLAHSAGALPVDLGGCQVDLAVGCGYKYLNGGPGAPAFLFVAKELQEAFQSPLSGWLGHAQPFAFDPDYRPAPGMVRHQCGTPPVLSLAALECGVDLMLAADLKAIRQKSMALGDFFIALIEDLGLGFALASPRAATQRGSQVSFRHAQGYPITQALIQRGVIGDFRAPDILRFGFCPLYVSFRDVWEAVAVLHAVMKTTAWDRPELKLRGTVT